jgi:hypothetical protein
VSETTKSLVADFFATMGAGDWERLRSELLTDESSWTMMAPSLQGGPPPMDHVAMIHGPTHPAGLSRARAAVPTRAPHLAPTGRGPARPALVPGPAVRRERFRPQGGRFRTHVV